jgi:hypothetical protein
MFEYFFHSGLVKDNLGQYNEAIKAYDKSIELKPAYILAVDNRRFAKNIVEQQKMKKMLKVQK